MPRHSLRYLSLSDFQLQVFGQRIQLDEAYYLSYHKVLPWRPGVSNRSTDGRERGGQIGANRQETSNDDHSDQSSDQPVLQGGDATAVVLEAGYKIGQSILHHVLYPLVLG